MKAVILLCLVAFAASAPQQFQNVPKQEDLESIEPYEFSVAVNDDDSTVYTSRQESQDANGVIRGEYSWVAANGIRYITTYTADAANGFVSNTIEEPTDIIVKLPVLQPQFQ
ncbi:hypothetical protein SK128_014432 [Halocaridina rubra]|uniref:Uncharacterized protein n=1 Tax=Halocaridina rubra TaxID=373956 RepID=A0AAN8WAZ2_HALRR